jgi:hypothetical protein
MPAKEASIIGITSFFAMRDLRMHNPKALVLLFFGSRMRLFVNAAQMFRRHMGVNLSCR